MDGRCESCRFWIPYRIATVLPAQVCALTVTASNGVPLGTDSRALAWGARYGDGDAVLVTAPDFGCVQYERKDG